MFIYRQQVIRLSRGWKIYHVPSLKYLLECAVVPGSLHNVQLQMQAHLCATHTQNLHGVCDVCRGFHGGKFILYDNM